MESADVAVGARLREGDVVEGRGGVMKPDDMKVEEVG